MGGALFLVGGLGRGLGEEFVLTSSIGSLFDNKVRVGGIREGELGGILTPNSEHYLCQNY